MPRSAHSVGVLALLPGRCATIALVIGCALPGNEAMGTTGVPLPECGAHAASRRALMAKTRKAPTLLTPTIPRSCPADCRDHEARVVRRRSVQAGIFRFLRPAELRCG